MARVIKAQNGGMMIHRSQEEAIDDNNNENADDK